MPSLQDWIQGSNKQSISSVSEQKLDKHGSMGAIGALFSGAGNAHTRPENTNHAAGGNAYAGLFNGGSSNTPSNGSIGTLGDEKRSRDNLMQQFCTLNGFDNAAADNEAAVVMVRSNVHGGRPGGIGSGGFAAPLASSVGMPANASLLADASKFTVMPTQDNPWSVFFGEGKYPYKSPFDVGTQDTWTLPDSLRGQMAPRISETIEQLVFLDSNWYTQRVAPIEVTRNMNIRWSRWIFNPHLTDVIPELGVNRLVQARREENSARFVRRGIGFMLEHGFMGTEEGIRHYIMSVNQVVQSAVETNKFDVIQTLLTAHDQNRQWLVQSNKYVGQRPYDVYKDELFYWDMPKLKKNALHLLDTHVTERMLKWRGVADTWIFPPSILVYLSQVPAEQTDYFIKGPAGPQTLNDGIDSFRTFRGNEVYITRSFNVEDGGTPVDIMEAHSQIGEHHLNYHRTEAPIASYTSSLRDLQFYDEDKDKRVTFTLRDALKGCNLFHEDGTLREPEEFNSIYLSYTPEERARNPFLYQLGNPEPKLRTIEYFINMKSEALSAESRLLLGQTVRNSVASKVKHWARADELLASVRVAVDQMESYSYATVQDVLPKIVEFGASRNSDARPSLPASNRPLFNIQEYPVNANTGSMTLVSGDVAAADVEGIQLPPGFQSFEGLKEIARVYNSRNTAGTLGTSVLRNVSSDRLKDISDFVEMFEQLASTLSRIFEGSLALNPSNAATWWQSPSPATVLFNYAVHKFRVPLWRLPAAVNGAAALEPNAALQTQLTSIIGRIRTNADTRKVGATTVAEIDAFIAYLTNGQLGAVTVGADYRTKFNRIVNYSIFLTLLGLVPATHSKRTEYVDRIAREFLGKEPFSSSAALDKELEADSFFKQVEALIAGDAPSGRARKEGGIFGAANVESVKNTIGELYKTFSTLEKQLPAGASGYSGSSGAAIRTTLLASPKLIEEIAAAIGAQNTEILFVPSSLLISDLPILRQEVESIKTSDTFAQQASTTPALVQAPVGNVAFAGNAEALEFVQIATSMSNTSDALASGQLSSTSGASSGSRLRSRSSSRPSDVDSLFEDDGMADNEFADIGTSLEDTFASRVGPNSALSTGLSTKFLARIQPSRHSDSMEISRFSQGRESLLSEVSRRNALELASLDAHSWAFVFATVFNLTPVRESVLDSFITNNILFPINFLLSRPHAEYKTCYGMKVKRGTETITTYQRPGEFEVGDDVNIGAHTGHYRYYSKVVVKQPRNVFIARSIFVNGYQRGMGSQLFKRQHYRPNDGEFGHGSLFVFAIGFEEREDRGLPAVVNVAGKLRNLSLLFRLESEALHYSTAAYYASFWDISKFAGLEIDRPARMAGDGFHANLNTLKGSTWYRDFRTLRFDDREPGQGHWTDYGTYDGCGRARRGELMEFVPPMTTHVHF
jgi:hypothetical protein